MGVSALRAMSVDASAIVDWTRARRWCAVPPHGDHAFAVTSVNFAISVGTRVPRSLHFYRVPKELVQINPRWRGYDYFLVGEQIIVLNPRTHEIVAVLDA